MAISKDLESSIFKKNFRSVPTIVAPRGIPPKNTLTFLRPWPYRVRVGTYFLGDFPDFAVLSYCFFLPTSRFWEQSSRGPPYYATLILCMYISDGPYKQLRNWVQIKTR